MKNLTRIPAAVLALALAFSPLFADASAFPVGTTQFSLSGAGITSSASTIQLTSFKLPDQATNIMMSMFGAIGYGALEPGTSAKLEDISFTGITQNSNGTATLTGVSRGLAFNTPYAASTTLRKSHAGGSTFIITDTAAYLGTEFAFVNNPNNFTDYNTFPTPLSSSNPATKGYVDGIVSGGTITSDRLVVAGTAGETEATGTVVYFHKTDARWYKAGTAITEATIDPIIGITQGPGTAGTAVTNGVLMHGLDQTQVGLTVGANYFLSSTAGATSTATSTQGLGKARTATQLYVDTHFYTSQYPSVSANNTFTGTNTFTGSTVLATSTQIGAFNAYSGIGKQLASFTSVGTTSFAVPTSVTKVNVTMCASGAGAGVNAGSGPGGGGGGGGCMNKNIDVTGTTTIQVFVGTGGGTATAGTWSTFGTNGFYASCTSGTPGGAPSAGSGGTCTAGDIIMPGGAGGIGLATNIGGFGGNSMLGFGGAMVSPNNGGNAGTGCGSGGGGSGSSGTASGGAGANGCIYVRW